MAKNVLEMLKREFSWFEFKVSRLERLKGTLYTLDTQGFERDFAIIKDRLSNIQNVVEVERLIYNLKLRIREKKMRSAVKIAELVEMVLECYDNIDLWSYEKIKEEYSYILKKYSWLPEEEKVFVYNVIAKLHKKIREKNE